MRESDLYIPVRDWLTSKGYLVHTEIFDADVVGHLGDQLCVVELKLSSPSELVHQLRVRAMWANLVWGAMPHRPKYTGEFKAGGYGLLLVKDGRVKEIVKPKAQPHFWHKRHGYRMKKLTGRSPAQPHELAGLPSCRALREQRILRNAVPEDVIAAARGEG